MFPILRQNCSSFLSIPRCSPDKKQMFPSWWYNCSSFLSIPKCSPWRRSNCSPLWIPVPKCSPMYHKCSPFYLHFTPSLECFLISWNILAFTTFIPPLQWSFIWPLFPTPSSASLYRLFSPPCVTASEIQWKTFCMQKYLFVRLKLTFCDTGFFLEWAAI